MMLSAKSSQLFASILTEIKVFLSRGSSFSRISGGNRSKNLPNEVSPKAYVADLMFPFEKSGAGSTKERLQIGMQRRKAIDGLYSTCK